MWQIFFFIVTTILSYYLQPKPPKPQPGQVQVPTAEEGRKVGVLFGSRWLKGPHTYWWGDVATTPIKR